MWRGSTVLFMVTFFEMLLASLLNVYFVRWDSENAVEKNSNYAAVTFLSIVAITFPAIVVFYTCNLSSFDYLNFVKSFGALIGESRYQSMKQRRVALLYPTLFFARRAIFVYSLIYLQSSLLVQLLL